MRRTADRGSVQSRLLIGLRTRAADPIVRFPFLVVVYLAAIGSTIATWLGPWYRDAAFWVSEVTARSAHVLLGLASESALRGRNVSYEGFTVEIIGECTGIYEVFIFASCVLAYPAPARAKVLGLPFGIASIYAFNLARILCLLAVGRHAPELFDFFHLYFWQSTLIVLVASVWFAWIRLFVRR
jgi:archaeosortase B (VPXXXP-CTERM-specific)